MSNDGFIPGVIIATAIMACVCGIILWAAKNAWRNKRHQKPVSLNTTCPFSTLTGKDLAEHCWAIWRNDNGVLSLKHAVIVMQQTESPWMNEHILRSWARTRNAHYRLTNVGTARRQRYRIGNLKVIATRWAFKEQKAA